MPQMPEETLDSAKSKYLTRFVTLKLVDISHLALNGNIDAVKLLVFYVEKAMGGAVADEEGVPDYWLALRHVEDAMNAEGMPA